MELTTQSFNALLERIDLLTKQAIVVNGQNGHMPGLEDMSNAPHYEALTLEPQAIRSRTRTILGFVDTRFVRHLLFIVSNGLDESVLIEIVGADVSDPSNDSYQFVIGGRRRIVTNGRVALIVDLERSWFPYYGVAIQPVVRPRNGNISATAHLVH